MLAPPAGSQPPPRWARGPLSVPCRSGTPAYRLQVKTRSRACIHTLSCVLQLRTSPPYRCGLWCYHMSCNSGRHLPAVTGSGAAMCHVSLGLSSQPRRAPALLRDPWLRTLSPCWGGLRFCPVVLCGLRTRRYKERVSWPR
jgi:hypothetical protein